MRHLLAVLALLVSGCFSFVAVPLAADRGACYRRCAGKIIVFGVGQREKFDCMASCPGAQVSEDSCEAAVQEGELEPPWACMDSGGRTRARSPGPVRKRQVEAEAED